MKQREGGHFVGLYTGLLFVAKLFSTTPSWSAAPNILICNNSGATEYRVSRAVRFWEALGHSFGEVYKATSENIHCASGEPPYATIMIDIPSQNFNFGSHLGTTKIWWTTTTGEIIKSKVEIKTGWENSERIIEHEIGHAIGYKDNSIIGHMMNSSWTRGGYNKKGLRRQESN